MVQWVGFREFGDAGSPVEWLGGRGGRGENRNGL